MAIQAGITGGIGSGKSTVASIFETLGIPVYRADDAAKRLMNEDMSVKTQIIKHFGDAIYANGLLDRKLLAAEVFNNEGKLAILNSIVHPATISDAQKWMQLQTAAYTLKEAAILFESGSQKHLQYIIGVYAPETLRIHRSMKRDNRSREEVKERINNQMDESIKMKLCNAVIINDEQQALIPQVMKVHETILQLAAH